jgi:hypothetical protein
MRLRLQAMGHGLMHEAMRRKTRSSKVEARTKSCGFELASGFGQIALPHVGMPILLFGICDAAAAIALHSAVALPALELYVLALLRTLWFLVF